MISWVISRWFFL